MPDQLQNEFERLHLQHLLQQEDWLLPLYEEAITDIIKSLPQIEWKGQVFRLKDYPALQRKVNRVIKRLQPRIVIGLYNSIQAAWELSNKKNDRLVRDRIGRKKTTKAGEQRLFDPNINALKEFIKRKEKGLDLSGRVWNALDVFSNEIETGLGIGIAEGKPAREMAKDLKRYLRYPDKLFRRVRSDKGELVLSKAAKNFHPGQGVYRSSFQNALRLAASETNIAYRSADLARWANLDFVIGIEVHLSANHPEFDICDHLAGRYPKDFHFVGWHPRCLCFMTPVQLTDKQFREGQKAILAGKPLPEYNQITKLPEGFRKYVMANAERIEGWKTTPYWVRDNKEYYDLAKAGKDAKIPLIGNLRELMTKAKEMGGEVDAVGNEYAKKYGGTVTPINFKSAESISRKARDDYGGDLRQVRDAVRNTVVVDFDQLDKAVKELEKDKRFLKVKVQDGPDYFGYKGVVSNYLTSNGTVGEMQVNSAGMIYAKEPKKFALLYMDEKTYNAIEQKTGLPGGKGHVYYEKIRVAKAKAVRGELNATELEQLAQDIEDSKKYYSNFYGF